jgi:hypothetical protein
MNKPDGGDFQHISRFFLRLPARPDPDPAGEARSVLHATARAVAPLREAKEAFSVIAEDAAGNTGMRIDYSWRWGRYYS